MNAKALAQLVLPAFWICAVAAPLAVIFASADLKSVIGQAFHTVRPLAVLATLPGQLLASLVCAAALLVLRPGVSFSSCLASRVLRDAGGNLLVFMPGLGEAIGARALILAGGKTRDAIAASALDVLAEGAAQVPYGLLAAVMLPHILQASGFGLDLPWTRISAIIAALLVVGWVLLRYSVELRMRVTCEIGLFRAQIVEHWQGLPLAFVLHVMAWALGGVQLWMAGWVLSFHLSLFGAIVMESAAYAARALLFFVPAGLAVQETGLVVTGLAFGLSAPQALTLALVLRLRDIVMGLPLLAWPLFEYRRRVRG